MGSLSCGLESLTAAKGEERLQETGAGAVAVVAGATVAAESEPLLSCGAAVVATTSTLPRSHCLLRKVTVTKPQGES